MIDTDEQDSIHFSSADQPELPEIAQEDIDAKKEMEFKKKLETLKWLEEHCDWQPFGDVW